MFKQIAALLRPKKTEPVAVVDAIEFPVKTKPATQKSTPVLVSTKTVAKKPVRKKTVAKV